MYQEETEYKKQVRLFYESIGVNIRNSRKQLGISQEELASTLDISRVSVGNIETGKQRLPVHLITDICSALKVSIGEIIPERTIRLASKAEASKEGEGENKESLQKLSAKIEVIRIELAKKYPDTSEPIDKMLYDLSCDLDNLQSPQPYKETEAQLTEEKEEPAFDKIWKLVLEEFDKQDWPTDDMDFVRIKRSLLRSRISRLFRNIYTDNDFSQSTQPYKELSEGEKKEEENQQDLCFELAESLDRVFEVKYIGDSQLQYAYEIESQIRVALERLGMKLTRTRPKELKPISEISDEDYIGLAKVMGIRDVESEDVIPFVKLCIEDFLNKKPVVMRADVYLYLQSKGYQLPVYYQTKID